MSSIKNLFDTHKLSGTLGHRTVGSLRGVSGSTSVRWWCGGEGLLSSHGLSELDYTVAGKEFSCSFKFEKRKTVIPEPDLVPNPKPFNVTKPS